MFVHGKTHRNSVSFTRSFDTIKKQKEKDRSVKSEFFRF
ncbi:hypothetical protein LEP1GSC121_4139 [Leptospira borgpetersenii serovar Castellonis str. 200801910]|uniref:Uncharacterized protein n=1 Tax=Leptospira borgpetersenii serovar Ballum TaxID=280505 RepID=A0A0S2IQT8_LEPBO|nr:hypothetical protein LBBP_01743 [Leptospira borgpetersenii serovar Ballum]EKQ92269.1 hypothetical protein LEP1GSC101_3222 [Leptospira borgpetersenii str. UI 09149]EKR01825.1 hypothetical protein LEP1GSC121_4139 [Leptospira borgpetersenii serovar Castellonis str. 200801910]EMN59461.1 hypothetical protein LEP1GSC090_1377 [Leptospira borgpetersenii serovar Javanica str. MK146]